MPIVKSETWKSIYPSLTGYSDAVRFGNANTPVAGAGPLVDDNTNNTGQSASGRDEGLATLWSYTVPTDHETECDRLLIAQSIGGLWDISAANWINAMPRTKFFLNVDGVAIHEAQLWARARYDAQGGTAEGAYGVNTIGKISEGTLPLFGDGLALTSTQTITVTINPIDYASISPFSTNNGLFPFVVRTTLWGVGTVTGRHVTLHGNYRPADLTAGQVAFSYTVPADGVTIRGAAVWIDAGSPTVIVARASLWCNDQLVQELGFLCGTNYRTAFAPWHIPLGFTLREGDTLELKGNPWCDTGGMVAVMLAGTATDLAAVDAPDDDDVVEPPPLLPVPVVFGDPEYYDHVERALARLPHQYSGGETL